LAGKKETFSRKYFSFLSFLEIKRKKEIFWKFLLISQKERNIQISVENLSREIERKKYFFFVRPEIERKRNNFFKTARNRKKKKC